MNGADTVGIAVDDSRIQLDHYINQLSMRANTFTIALIDCCRTKEAYKQGPQVIDNISINGKSLTLYAATEGKPALAPAGGLSKATDEFLKYMGAYN